MEGIALEYFPSSIDTGNNEENSEFCSYISDENEQDACYSHANMFHLLKIFLESGILVSGMSPVWEDTDGCAKQYRCALSKYLMTMLSSSYAVIMDCAINAPSHGNNVICGLNANEKRYLKGGV